MRAKGQLKKCRYLGSARTLVAASISGDIVTAVLNLE